MFNKRLEIHPKDIQVDYQKCLGSGSHAKIYYGEYLGMAVAVKKFH